MTQPYPPPDAACRELTDELRRARPGGHERELDARLVPVEGGEPMLAEELPPVRPHATF